MGNIVFFLYPRPNGFNDPSVSYRKGGLKNCINVNRIRNKIIEKCNLYCCKKSGIFLNENLKY